MKAKNPILVQKGFEKKAMNLIEMQLYHSRKNAVCQALLFLSIHW